VGQVGWQQGGERQEAKTSKNCRGFIREEKEECPARPGLATPVVDDCAANETCHLCLVILEQEAFVRFFRTRGKGRFFLPGIAPKISERARERP